MLVVSLSVSVLPGLFYGRVEDLVDDTLTAKCFYGKAPPTPSLYAHVF